MKFESNEWSKQYLLYDEVYALYRSQETLSLTLKLVFLKYILQYGMEYAVDDKELQNCIADFNIKALSKQVDSETIRELVYKFGSVVGDVYISNINYTCLFDKFDLKKSNEAMYTVFSYIDFNLFEKDKSRFFAEIIRRSKNDLRYFSFRSDAAIVEFAKHILRVESDDIFMDCCSGISSTYISMDECSKYIGCELNAEVVGLSNMMLFMTGRKNTTQYVGDFLKMNIQEKATKIFADFPRIDTETTTVDGKKTRDFTLVGINQILPLMDDNSEAVVTATPRLLSSSAIVYKEFRTKLINNGLKAVIMLPTLSKYDSILLWIEQGYDGDVLFATLDVFDVAYRRDNGDFEKAIENAADEIFNMKEIKGLTVLVKRDLVRVKNVINPYDYYASKTEPAQTRNIEAINEELDSLYSELNNILRN